MWSQSPRGNHSCRHRPKSAPWPVFEIMSHGGKKKKKSPVLTVSVPLTWMPVWPCSEKHRRGEWTGRNFYSNPAVTSLPANLPDTQSEKPHAGGRRSYLPVLQGSQSPVLTLSHPSSPRLPPSTPSMELPTVALKNRVISRLGAHVASLWKALPACLPANTCSSLQT